MTTSRQHQEAHGIGQIEDQLGKQAEAAERLQGGSATDREVISAGREEDSELDDIIET